MAIILLEPNITKYGKVGQIRDKLEVQRRNIQAQVVVELEGAIFSLSSIIAYDSPEAHEFSLSS